MSLTVKQFATISLGQVSPPWHLADILAIYNLKSFSLRAEIDIMSSLNAVIFISVVDNTILKNVSNTSDLQSKWFSQPLTKPTLENLQNILATVGGSIVYINRRTNIIGISATFGRLANIPTFSLTGDSLNNITNLLQLPLDDNLSIEGDSSVAEFWGGVVAVGSGAATIGGGFLAGPFGPWFWVGGGLQVAGGLGLIGDSGIFSTGNSASPTPDPQPTMKNLPSEDDGATVWGPWAPPEIDSLDPPQTPIDLSSFPVEAPPGCPPICPPPVCPPPGI